MRKVILTAAICGETTREQNPFVPYSPSEIAESAIKAGEAGAAIAHIHVRDEHGLPTFKASVYSDVIDRIRRKSDLIINCTTGGKTFEEKTDVLKIDPEIATLNCGSANLREKTMINTHEELVKTAEEMLDRGIKPEIMIHSQGFVLNAKKLISKGLIENPPLYNLFFASGGMEPTLKNLIYLVESIPEGSFWTATGYGDEAIPFATLSMLAGGNARIGLEDCIYLKGKPAESNAQLILKVRKIAEELNLDVATPEEARKMLNIARARMNLP